MKANPHDQLAAYLRDLQQVYEQFGGESPFNLSLSGKARGEDLTALEKALGQPINAELAALWSITGGSGSAPIFHDGELLFSYALLSPAQALREREYYRARASQYEPGLDYDRDPRVGRGWFSDGWLPFAETEGGSAQLIVDHQPLGNGVQGQVLRYVHDPDEIEFVAPSLLELLPLSLRSIRADPREFLCIF